MFLDWKPLNKPMAGYEYEYSQIFHYLIKGKKKSKVLIWDKIIALNGMSKEKLEERFKTISVPAHITINVPKVGIDYAATNWAIQQFENRLDSNMTFEEYMEEMKGKYIFELVDTCDGITKYVPLYENAHVFRASFLVDCVKVIGNDLVKEAYKSKLADEALEYAQRIKKIADRYAKKNNCLKIKNAKEPPNVTKDSPESITHVLYSSVKYLKFWGVRGHGIESVY